MARGSREVKVLITGDASKLTKALDSVETKARGTSGVLKGVFAGVSVLAIGRGLSSIANQFEDTALAANNFATASGLSVEEASRWNEVAGDFKIDSGKVSSSMLKMSKNLSTNVHKWEDYGIVVAQTADGQVDINKTFINTIDKLGKIKDPLERAQVGSELFGRSWADLAPLIALGADGITDSLNSVAEAQVMTPEKAREADEFRRKMDDLSDSVDVVKLNLAEALLPAISSVAGFLADNMNPTLGTTIAALAGSVGLAWAIGKVTTAVSGTISMLDLFAKHPVIAATILVVAGIAVIVTHWDQVTAAIQRAIAAMDEFSNKTFGPVGDLLNKIPGVNLDRKQSTTSLGPASIAALNKQTLDQEAARRNLAFAKRATGGNAWGPFLAGERGPELIWPRGSGAYVSTAGETAGMLGRGGGPLLAVDKMYLAGEDDMIRLGRLLDRQKRREERGKGRVRV